MTSKKFLPIGLLTFVNTIGFSILIPVLPFVTERYGAGAITYGLLLSAYAFFQFLGAPIIGSLSDKYGRRPTLILSQAGTLLSWVIFGIAYFLPNIDILGISLPILVIFLSRMIDGITGGNNSVANAYIADISTREERTKFYGMVGAIFGLGFIVGPVLGGYTTSFSIGYLGTVIAAAAISLFTLLMIILYLKESLTDEKRDKELEIHLWSEINIVKKIREFKDNKLVTHLFWRHFIFAFAFGTFTSTFALYAKDFLGLDAKELGLLMLVIGIFSVFNHALIAPKLAKKLGNRKTFNLGQLVLALSIAALFFRVNLMVYFALMYLTNLGMGLSMPTFKTMLTGAVSEKEQGRVTGVDESIMAGSNGLAPMFGGFLYGGLSLGAFPIFASILLIPYLLWGFDKRKQSKLKSRQAVSPGGQ